MANGNDPDSSQAFARAFGDALNHFLNVNNLSQREAARQMGLDGREGGARISTYCRDNKDERRSSPDAEILYLALTRLTGFKFEYRGFNISAEMISHKEAAIRVPEQQLEIDFDRQFNLTQKMGTVSVTIRKPSDRIEVSLSLNAMVS